MAAWKLICPSAFKLPTIMVRILIRKVKRDEKKIIRKITVMKIDVIAVMMVIVLVVYDDDNIMMMMMII